MREGRGPGSQQQGRGLPLNRVAALACLLVVGGSLTGCGTGSGVDSTKSPTGSNSPCAEVRPDSAVPSVKADLDGDGVPETVSYDDGHGVCKVAPHLGAILGGNDLSAPFAPRGLVNSQGMHRVRIPGRTGDLVLVDETQPRGGFQAHLFGYAKGVFQELTAAGVPLFPFVATDVSGSALMAICTPDGFDVTTGALHSSSDAPPFWQVARTSFTVTGNVVSKGALRVIARKVSEAQLRSRYPGLVSNQLFENCL